jgi:uncharacterized membrane protein YdbT with pleckstrin-like domain
LLCIPLIGVFGLGLFLLIGWYFSVKETTLIITNKQIILTKGLWSKKTNIIPFDKTIYIDTNQSFLQRIMGVGTVIIYSGANQKIEVNGIPNPSKIKRLLKP